MIYCLFNGNGHYDGAHCDTFIGWGLADGFVAAGESAAVLWGGGDTTVNGIAHKNYLTTVLGPDDTLIYYSKILGGDALFSAPAYAGLRSAGRKIWYPGWASSCRAGFWDAMIIENLSWVPKVQSASEIPIIGSLFGCPHDVDFDVPNPYTIPGKHLFYAGRLMQAGVDNQLLTMGRLLKLLPADYHVWVASSCLWIPGTYLYSPVGYAGEDMAPVEGMSGWYHLQQGTFRDFVTEYMNEPRLHFLGSMAYGSFFDRIRHADCVLDFGYTMNHEGANCKVMEPLRFGAPVIADGISYSFGLIDKYGAGKVVPYRNLQAMADAVVGLPAETADTRRRRGDLFRDGESWRQGAIRLLDAFRKLPNKKERLDA